MTATALLSDGTTGVVTSTAAWQSSNPAVATVSFAGRVTAVTAGTSTISAAYQGRTGQIPVQVVAVDNVQRVRLVVTDVVVTGTCDENSLFEDNVDGEFFFQVDLLRDGGTRTIWATGPEPYTKGTHPIDRSVTPFNRNVTRGDDFTLRFEAYEFDGLLGGDSRLNGHFTSRTYTYQGGEWTPSTRSIELSPDANCGATVVYTIESEAQS